MKLKTSLFKKGFIISDLKRFWWVSALYTLALFFSIPFNHYIQKFNSNINNGNLDWMKESITRDLSFETGSNQVFLIFVPIVIGALVFRYMQKSRSASLYHSLPLTRAALYFNSVISAVILFVSPLLCITLTMFVLNWFSFLSAYYTSILILSWLLYSLLFGILFLAMTIFVGMFTGSSIAQLAFVYILNFLPMFFVEFIRLNIRHLLFGFDTYSNVDFYNNMPMAKLFRGSDELSVTLIIVYILVTLALLIGGLFAFKIRKPETAGDIITFRPIKPIFVYGVTVCATLLGGSYFLSIGGSYFLANGKSSLPLVLFGYFVSSLVSYATVQMITNRSFKILHTYKGYIGYALVLVILTLGIEFDVIGYVNKIPAPSEVEETYIGYNLVWWENKDNPEYAERFKHFPETLTTYKDPQNIENVTNLHKLILDNQSKNGGSEYIAYKLKNGKKIIRKYSIDTDLYASALGPIYESKEYKEGRYPILYQEAKDLKYIGINDSRTGNSPLIISDKAKLDSFKTAISKDIENLSYTELVSNFQRVLYIDIIDTKDKNIVYELRSCFTNTLEWLKKEGIYEQIVLKPEAVTSVTLENSYYKGKLSTGETMTLEQPKRIEITDKAVIGELLNLTLDTDYKNNVVNYSISLNQSRNSYMLQMGFDDNISAELQSYIDKIK